MNVKGNKMIEYMKKLALPVMATYTMGCATLTPTDFQDNFARAESLSTKVFDLEIEACQRRQGRIV